MLLLLYMIPDIQALVPIKRKLHLYTFKYVVDAMNILRLNIV